MLQSSVILIVLGEILSWALNYFESSNTILSWALNYFESSNTSALSDFTSGLLLGLSVGMKLIGIILILIYIVKSRGKK